MTEVPKSGEFKERVPAPASVGVEREGEIAVGSTRDSERDLRNDRPEGARAPSRSGAMADFVLLARVMLRNRRGWPIIRLALAITAVLIANMLGQVRLNRWNGAFFDAIEKRNTDAFVSQLGVFLVIIAALLVLVVAQTWLQERFKIRLREGLTHLLLDLWLKPNRAYQLGLVGEAGTQPDQRLQEDCRLYAELTTELGVGMLNALFLLVSFIGVLWFLSSN